ncbi:MAG TPA: UDP-N-acetylglucosamine--N-acetylmuramyl-(pentapeptide) pyrophosphoryl-undecaprenol N-acetylglucosamine transferase [Terrimesophilobacter sp.]|nr:UDP-N-acetylglucosamine--N-acetylmuramyl-(pentapeptide) pyrophosphoryl-undecaprenol N-acetylglucosamine transferase [Terrimesophilobacter sp.]
MTRYLLVGGGTAGHVNPLLAVADRLREQGPDDAILVLGTAEGLEARLVPERGYELTTIARVPFPRRPGRAALRFPREFRDVVRSIRALLLEREIDVVVGFGGFVSGPAYVAAWRQKVPIVVHEANAVPGFANRLGSRLTRYVGVAFPGTRLPHARVVGMPLKHELEVLDPRVRHDEALEHFALDAAKPVLLVTGGSLGARSINETVFEAAATILGAGWSILHIAGERAALPEPSLADYRILAYCDRMDLAFSAAELVIARAGSATVSELTALGVAAIYVPLAIGNGEQRLNAKGVVDAGGAVLVDNADFTPEWVSRELIPILGDRAAIAELAARAAKIGSRDGTARTVALVREAVEAAARTEGGRS